MKEITKKDSCTDCKYRAEQLSAKGELLDGCGARGEFRKFYKYSTYTCRYFEGFPYTEKESVGFKMTGRRLNSIYI